MIAYVAGGSYPVNGHWPPPRFVQGQGKKNKGEVCLCVYHMHREGQGHIAGHVVRLLPTQHGSVTHIFVQLPPETQKPDIWGVGWAGPQ